MVVPKPGANIRQEGGEEATANPTDTLLMPCTKRGSVGILFNFKVPSPLVYLMKGSDYKLGKARGVVDRGVNPYGMRE